MRVLPSRLSQIAIAIETLLHTFEMSLEEVIGRLKAAEDHLESQEPSCEQGKLLLTDEQWLERMKGDQGGGSSKPARGNVQRRRNEDADHRVRRVGMAAAIVQQLGMAYAMTHVVSMVVMAIGPRTTTSLGETWYTWPKQMKLLPWWCSKP